MAQVLIVMKKTVTELILFLNYKQIDNNALLKIVCYDNNFFSMFNPLS